MHGRSGSPRWAARPTICRWHTASTRQSQLFEAAAAGLGAAIVQRCLVGDYIDDGRLRIAWDAEVVNSRGYYLVHPSHQRLHRPLTAFRQWIREEAQASELAQRNPPASTGGAQSMEMLAKMRRLGL